MNTKYTSEECLQAYYDSLEKQLAEKDAMIDWLAEKLQVICQHEVPDVCAMLDIDKCPFFPDGKIFTEDNHLKCKAEKIDWRLAAQEAVKKNAGR